MLQRRWTIRLKLSRQFEATHPPRGGSLSGAYTHKHQLMKTRGSYTRRGEGSETQQLKLF